MPCNYKKYPPNWKTEIVPRILERAGEVRSIYGGSIVLEASCEWCGVVNHTTGIRRADGTFDHLGLPYEMEEGERFVKIVLTVAHLDHDMENWDVKDDRLAALCQRCHNRYDAKHRAAGIKARREAKNLSLGI